MHVNEAFVYGWRDSQSVNIPRPLPGNDPSSTENKTGKEARVSGSSIEQPEAQTSLERHS